MMLNSHSKFHSANGKRQILIADDEMINREILGNILQSDYEIIYAADGAEALAKVRECGDTLSLVILDIQMPEISGMDVLRQMKSDPDLEHIPVIVITSEREAEVDSLSLGAIDFIPKPYPQVGVIMARVRRTIELSEDRQIINSTERDPLTGLYNREYFYRYAEQFDHHHKDVEMDAIIVDINHFHMINERFGTAYGDGVLKRIGEKVREMVLDTGGIVCRREADTFMVYCPHGKDYKTILDNASAGIDVDSSVNNRIRLRMGVYANVDKGLDIERRFDRAKMAADTVRNSFAKTIGIYDNVLHEKELYAEQLIEDFPRAIDERQFVVFYQPKFDVRPDIPVLASAEALVRWKHPDLGMISPGVFIPLFEDNGLIQELDNYVWSEAARQIRDWKDRFEFAVPVSVNVSRIDMYDPDMIGTLEGILRDNDITAEDLLLEITESAYTQDSEQIIETVNKLRALGFKIEMDDFGTGYSSLNMISTLPIDALKLDMQFIRNAFNQRKDTRMLEVIIDIADYLSVPVIAEGVETDEQLNALKAMGCGIVQGYYFSRPVPPEEYERFVIERKEQGDAYVEAEREAEGRLRGRSEGGFVGIAHALSSGFESIYYVDTRNDHYVEFSSRGKYEDLQIEKSGADFFADTQKNIVNVVYPADIERVSLCMRKDDLLAQLIDDQTYSMTYRLVIDGEPVYYNLKAVKAGTHDDHHIVVGVSNVDRQIREADVAAAGQDENVLNFGGLAKALSSDIECIYYVDTDNDTYLEFHIAGEYSKVDIDVSGEDFFSECQSNIPAVIHPDDQKMVSLAMGKERLIETLRDHMAFSLIYRLMIDGKPMYYRLKVVHATPEDTHHIIIGISNVNGQFTEQDQIAAANRESVTFARIAQALSHDYFSIYYVDTETDNYIEYTSPDDYKKFGVETEGCDFFNRGCRDIMRKVHPDDAHRVLAIFDKEHIMEELGSDKTFTLTYRLMCEGTPKYVHMKITRMDDGRHIVIGVSDIDEQIRREQDHTRALQMVNRDPLTGVKSKHAYVEAEAVINQSIGEGAAEPFAVVVCDVNDLKLINDTKGHNAGDRHIIAACKIICDIFDHSPVYRVGGDEFVAILKGGDYEKRSDLMEELILSNTRGLANGGATIAGGMSEYRSGEDLTVATIFERADKMMYDNKRMIKGE